MSGMYGIEWTPSMEAWVVEALSRSKPLTLRQLEIIAAEVRNNQPSQAA